MTILSTTVVERMALAHTILEIVIVKDESLVVSIAKVLC